MADPVKGIFYQQDSKTLEITLPVPILIDHPPSVRHMQYACRQFCRSQKSVTSYHDIAKARAKEKDHQIYPKQNKQERDIQQEKGWDHEESPRIGGIDWERIAAMHGLRVEKCLFVCYSKVSVFVWRK